MITGPEEKKRVFLSLLTCGLAMFKSNTEKEIDEFGGTCIAVLEIN